MGKDVPFQMFISTSGTSSKTGWQAEQDLAMVLKKREFEKIASQNYCPKQIRTPQYAEWNAKPRCKSLGAPKTLQRTLPHD